jgi:hypothetical protein
MKKFSFLVLSFLCSVLSLHAQVIDHDDVATVSSFSQTTMNLIGQQKWFFAHASVGSNMIDGINSLHSSNPTRYPLRSASVAYNDSVKRANNPPASTVAGTIYECGRGNPGWEQKTTIFDNSVRFGGWCDTAVDAVMDKFCYIDPDANATTYLSKMAALETSYPNTVVVYMTIPLTTSTDNSNVLRNQFNQAVRTYCINNAKLLFDIADMEAYSPSGIQSTFLSGGNTYQKLYSGYTGDGGHLNTAGAQQIALGWYATAANVPEPGSLMLIAGFTIGILTRHPKP